MAADAGVSGRLPASGARRLVLLVFERALLLVALAALGYVAGSIGGASIYQDYESQQLDAVLRGARPPVAAGAPAATRRVLGRLEIPSLGVSTIVREGEDARTLQLAVGHIAGTALPGAPGNMGLAGHRDTFFRRLREIETGRRHPPRGAGRHLQLRGGGHADRRPRRTVGARRRRRSRRSRW